jgi:hypothetical protein
MSTLLYILTHTDYIYSYAVVTTPNADLALRNCLVVYPSDFPHGVYVLVRKVDRDSAQREYPFTTWSVQRPIPDSSHLKHDLAMTLLGQSDRVQSPSASRSANG